MREALIGGNVASVGRGGLALAGKGMVWCAAGGGGLEWAIALV